MPKDAIEPLSIIQEKYSSIRVASGRVQLSKDKECE